MIITHIYNTSTTETSRVSKKNFLLKINILAWNKLRESHSLNHVLGQQVLHSLEMDGNGCCRLRLIIRCQEFFKSIDKIWSIVRVGLSSSTLQNGSIDFYLSPINALRISKPCTKLGTFKLNCYKEIIFFYFKLNFESCLGFPYTPLLCVVSYAGHVVYSLLHIVKL